MLFDKTGLFAATDWKKKKEKKEKKHFVGT